MQKQNRKYKIFTKPEIVHAPGDLSTVQSPGSVSFSSFSEKLLIGACAFEGYDCRSILRQGLSNGLSAKQYLSVFRSAVNAREFSG